MSSTSAAAAPAARPGGSRTGSETTESTDTAETSPEFFLALLPDVVKVATQAGDRVLALYSPANRVADTAELMAAARANEDASAAGLRQALADLRPQASWLEEEQETTPLPGAGSGAEFWVVDTVEGNVNHVHGLPRWCVSITLVREGTPVLAVVRQPVGDLTYTAVAGAGAHLNGAPLSTSAKVDLELAVVETGQAEAGQDGTYERIGASVVALLRAALAVRVQVPSTFPMLSVAAGHTDAFWQYAPTLPGLAAGVLMITEAGGVVSTAEGHPWAPGADSILVAAPGVHAAASGALRGVPVSPTLTVGSTPSSAPVGTSAGGAA